MWSTPFNPFTWDKSSQRVTTNVVSLDVRNETEDLLTISGLSPGVTILVPLRNPFAQHPANISFGILGVILHHNITVQYGHSMIQIAIVPDDDHIVVPYIRVSQTREISSQNRLLECKRAHGQWLHTGNITCEGTTNVTITFVAFYPGNYLLETEFGAQPNSENKDQTHDEENRDESQCIKIKEPPRSKTENIKYRFTVTEAACLFWDSDKSNWKTAGCKVNKYPCHRISVCFYFV